jgi:hypothetical protein
MLSPVIVSVSTLGAVRVPMSKVPSEASIVIAVAALKETLVKSYLPT